jgi:hypothetical protein
MTTQPTVPTGGSPFDMDPHPARPVDAPSAEREAIAPQAPQTATVVEGATRSPQRLSRDEAMGLLSEAVATSMRTTPAPTAAGVYSLMRRLAPDFTYRQVGFSSFRALLDEARKRGLVHTAPTEDGADLSVHLLAKDLPAPASAPTAVAHAPNLTLRRDFWRALTDWSDQARYVFDRDSSEIVADSENMGASREGLLVIPSIHKSEQLTWMKEFAESETSEGSQASLLAGLSDDTPTRGFSLALRDMAPAGRRWKKYLRKRVLDRATRWATDNSIPLSSLLAPENSSPSATSIASRRDQDEGEGTRDEILALLARLPLSELLRLRIPVEYAIHP